MPVNLETPEDYQGISWHYVWAAGHGLLSDSFRRYAMNGCCTNSTLFLDQPTHAAPRTTSNGLMPEDHNYSYAPTQVPDFVFYPLASMGYRPRHLRPH
jgi:hypothetical protein